MDDWLEYDYEARNGSDFWDDQERDYVEEAYWREELANGDDDEYDGDEVEQDVDDVYDYQDYVFDSDSEPPF